jgi:predicted RNA methylase
MKLSADAVDVLNQCRLEQGRVYLPNQTLDRKLYVEVNKALEALGLKWDKKSKSHLPTEPLEDLEDQFFMVVQTGQITTEKDKNLDFFATPPELASEMARRVAETLPQTILEPSAGDGALAVQMRSKCPSTPLTMIELDAKRAQVLRGLNLGEVLEQDFMTYTPSQPFDAVIMNPPFSKRREIKHVLRALDLLKPGGFLAAVMSVALIQRTDALTSSLRAILEAGNAEILRNPKGAFKSSGTMVDTITVFYTKG